MSDLSSNDEDQQVIEALLGEDHALWYDFIDERIRQDGSRGERLRGNPVLTQGFRKFYGITEDESVPNNELLSDMVSDRDRRLVLRSIVEAKRPGASAVSIAVSLQIKTGPKKLVHVYRRRVRLSSGKCVLASMLSDLKDAGPEKVRLQRLFDSLPCFIFEKEWDESKQLFIFRRINRNLEEVFRKIIDGSPLGRSDEDYIADEEQRKIFRNADLAVRDCSDPHFRLVSEEWFTTKPARDAGPVEARRLLTIKTPSDEHFEPGSSAKHRVLGIAMDVTMVTDVLRSMVAESKVAVYLKEVDQTTLRRKWEGMDDQKQDDPELVYFLVNRAFAQLMGNQEPRDFIGRPFSKMAAQSHGNAGAEILDVRNTDSLAKLTKDVTKEDWQVLRDPDGNPRQHARFAMFHNGMLWKTDKKRVRVGDGENGHDYVLGFADEFFGGELAKMLDQMPQAVSVKMVDRDEKNDKRRFKIVWGNKAYLRRHGVESLEQLIRNAQAIGYAVDGRICDADLWPNPIQVDGFYEKDCLALKAGQEMWNNSSLVDWEKLVKRLKDCDVNCWQFDEQVTRDGNIEILQTSKWPIYTHGEWFIVVDYSDVTELKDLIEAGHSGTSHYLRGSLSIIGSVADNITKFRAHSKERLTTDDLNLIDTVLKRSIEIQEEMTWFLERHKQLCSPSPKVEFISVDSIYDRINRLRPAFERRLNPLGELTIRRGIENRQMKDLQIAACPHHLDAIITELLLNAQKRFVEVELALQKWEDPLSRLRLSTLEGWVENRLGWIEDKLVHPWIPYIGIELNIACEELVLSVEDNGPAFCNWRRRFELIEKVKAAETMRNRDLYSHGLHFCFSSAKKMNAKFGLDISSKFAKFSLRLRIVNP